MLISESKSLEEIWEMIQLELKKGTSTKRHPFRFVVLSTVSKEGVSSRWVVYRKFTTEGKLLVYTDSRSEKCTELKRNPKCSLLFYHERQKLQIRIEAEAKLHLQDELTAKFWPGVKGSNPGDYISVRGSGEEINQRELGYEKSLDLNDRYFTVLEFNPLKIDVLQLNEDRHIRIEFKRTANEWESTFLVP